MRIAFFGTPDFAAYSLNKIVEAGFNVVAVITSPDKPAGRGQKLHESAVKTAAKALNLPIFQPTNLKAIEFVEAFHALDIDLAVVIAFRMLPEIVWNAPEMGSMNLHASLLPNYRGAAPIQHAIINGESETGVTTFFLKHEIDTGDIIEHQKVAIDLSDNASSLHDKLMVIGADVVVKSLQRINIEGHKIQLTPQNSAPNDPSTNNQQLFNAPKLSREFCEISDLNSADTVWNKIRGLSNYPGAWIHSPWGVMKVLEAKKADLSEYQISPSVFNIEPFFIHHNDLYLKCLDGNFLEIKRLKLSGKAEMDGKSLVNGLKSKK